MRRRDGLKHATRLGLWAAAATSVSWAATTGTTGGGAGTGGGTPMDAPSLMRLVQRATEERSFTGTYVVTASGAMTSSRIVHVCEGRNQVEHIEALDGQARHVFRHNDIVHVLWPSTKEATIEQRRYFRRFPLQANAGELSGLTMYDVLDTGQDRIAGQDTHVVTFRAKDALRFAQRWWIDKKTGMLLRVDTVGQHGEVIESAAYSDIQFSTRPTAQALLLDMNRLDGYRVLRPQTQATDLEREGWSLRATIPGFQPVSSVRRTRMRSAARAAEAASTSPEAASAALSAAALPVNTLLQSIFSDGLTHVSLFIEPFAMHPQRHERIMTSGATQMVTRRQGDWWVTAVGDVPHDTLAQFVTALERRKAGP